MKKNQLEQGVNEENSSTFRLNQSEKLDAFIRLRAAQERQLTPLLIVALGGYGRQNLAPYSDIDLLIYSESALSREEQSAVRRLSAWPWPDGRHLSLMVHDKDSLQTLMQHDVAFLTSLLDRRRINGKVGQFTKLGRIIDAELKRRGPVNLIAAKLAEQDARHRAQGDNRSILQPDVKEGKGGLRDLHTLRWIGKFVLGDGSAQSLTRHGVMRRDEARQLDKAETFFETVRYHLHSMAGRAQDRLSFEFQPAIAEAMGYSQSDPTMRAETFMRDYFAMTQETAQLTRIFCTALESRALSAGGATGGRRKPAVRQVLDGFPLQDNRLNLPPIKDFVPEDVARLFRIAQIHDMDIHPDAYRRLRRILPQHSATLRASTGAHRIFLDILQDSRRFAQTMRRMNEANLLSATFEDFAHIRNHMQFDMYHSFTVDEHTIRACAILHEIADGQLQDRAPLATTLFPTLAMPHVVFLAMFFHDMAKGSGLPHGTAGAAIARKVAPRFGLDTAETEAMAWLVEHHLLMTETAFKRDLEDPKTIDDFVTVVQSPERLKMLEIMTVADIMAVGPDIWNNWKGELLRQLYHRSYAQLTGTENLARQTEDVELVINRAGPFPQIIFQPNEYGDLTRLIVVTPDAPGLFSLLAGAIAAAGASIVQARIQTLSDGLAADIFDLQDIRGRAYDNEKFLNKTLRAALAGRLNIAEEISERRRQQRRVQKTRARSAVIIDNSASYMHTLLEVQAPDRPGLLHDITACLTAEGVNIQAAKVATFGPQAADVFYIKDAFGLKIEHPDRLASLEKALMIILATQAKADL